MVNSHPNQASAYGCREVRALGMSYVLNGGDLPWESVLRLQGIWSGVHPAGATTNGPNLSMIG